MFARAVPGFFLLWVLMFLPVRFTWGQELHLKSKGNPIGRWPKRSGNNGQHHVILHFDHSPDAGDITLISNAGATIVASLPDQALMVSIPGNITLPPGVALLGSLQVEDKMSAELLRDGWNAAVIEFHGDVEASVENEIGAEEGFVFVRNPWLRPGHVLAYGTYQELTALAAHDEVAYIFPADQSLALGGEVHACAGMLTQNGPVAQYSNIVHGWDLDSDHIAHLTYVFAEITNKLSALQAETEVLRAFSEWSKISNVSFEQGTNPSAPRNLLVRFASGSHADAYPFDGPGGMLAHTFYPVPVNSEPIAGDMHFDADENWHIGGDIDLYSVALHEAGHAIGLGHSDKPGDVMYPYYRSGLRLSANDIAGAQYLYGAPAGTAAAPITVAPPPTPPTPTPTTPAPVPTPSPGPAPSLTISSVPSSVSASSLSLSGTISGGTAPVNVTWQNGRGGSGKVSVTSGGNWTVAGIALQPGVNVLSVNVMDSSHRSATRSVSVTLSVPVSTAPAATLAIAIQSPSSATLTSSQNTITVSGTVSGGKGVSAVTWRTSTGQTGSAPVIAGSWVANNVPLFVGANFIVVQVADASGAIAWSSVLVVHH